MAAGRLLSRRRSPSCCNGDRDSEGRRLNRLQRSADCGVVVSQLADLVVTEQSMAY